MNQKFLKSILIPAAILAVLALSMASCQRGYGCPYGLSKTHGAR